jgi:hypothetical protein
MIFVATKNGSKKQFFLPLLVLLLDPGSGINIPDPQHCFIFLMIFFQECKYLPEHELKQLCDIVCDLLLEESNIQVTLTFSFNFKVLFSAFFSRICTGIKGLDPNLVTHKIDIFKKSQAFLQGVVIDGMKVKLFLKCFLIFFYLCRLRQFAKRYDRDVKNFRFSSKRCLSVAHLGSPKSAHLGAAQPRVRLQLGVARLGVTRYGGYSLLNLILSSHIPRTEDGTENPPIFVVSNPQNLGHCPEGVCTDEFLSRKPGFLLSAMHRYAFGWFSASPLVFLFLGLLPLQLNQIWWIFCVMYGEKGGWTLLVC